MKKTLIKTFASCLVFVVICFLAAAICNGKTEADRQKTTAEASKPYPIPEEKAQLWESLKNVAQKDYDVCQEHCGYEQSCLDKCEAAYNSRLEREYMMLMEKKETAPKK